MDLQDAQRLADKQSGMLQDIGRANRMHASVTEYLAAPPNHAHLACMCMQYGEAAVLEEIDNREK